MKRTKVLEVIRQGQIGGGESHLIDLIDLMDKERYEPLCLSFTGGEMISRLEAMGIKCHVIETTTPFNLSIVRQIERLVRDEGISIIHCHGTRAASNMLLPALHLGVPMIYTVHGWSFHDDQGKLTFNLRRWSEKLICHCARKVICVSDGNADTGRKAFGLKDVTVIKNGVNLRRFNPETQSALKSEDFGFGASDFVAGFIARCTKQKAPLDFLEAVRQAHAADSRVKGLFVGEGDMDADVDNYIATHDMGSYVFRSPFRQDIPDVLQLVDVYCLPSLWEGLSIALLEAMATGRAIVATPTDGTKEVLSHEQNGLIIPFEAPDQLAAAILRFLNEESLRKLCQQNVARLIAERFNAQHTADAVIKVYDSVAI